MGEEQHTSPSPSLTEREKWLAECEHKKAELELKHALATAEREKWQAEAAFRNADLQLRRADVRLRRRDLISAQWRSPIVLAIIGATIAALGNGGVAYFNARAQRALEEEKAARTLILEAVKTGDSEEARVNLLFLLDAGLVTTTAARARLLQYVSKTPKKKTAFLPSPVEQNRAATTNPDLHADPSVLTTYASPWCMISESKTIAYCHADSREACEQKHAASADGPFKQNHHCEARPATFHCFAYHSMDRRGTNTMMLLHACFTDTESCESRRKSYATIPGIIEIGGTCDALSAPK